MLDIINMIGASAIAMVRMKYPKEFSQRMYRREVFDLVEMVAEELSKKNMDIFTKPYLDQLVDIKDLKDGSFEREYVCIFYTKQEKIK